MMTADDRHGSCGRARGELWKNRAVRQVRRKFETRESFIRKCKDCFVFYIGTTTILIFPDIWVPGLLCCTSPTTFLRLYGIRFESTTVRAAPVCQAVSGKAREGGSVHPPRVMRNEGCTARAQPRTRTIARRTKQAYEEFLDIKLKYNRSTNKSRRHRSKRQGGTGDYRASTHPQRRIAPWDKERCLTFSMVVLL